jgi:hypothetical protein
VTELEEKITGELGDIFASCGLPASILTQRLASGVRDSASIFVVGDKTPLAILAISPEEFPDLVSAEHEKASRMKRALEPELGSPIVISMAQGLLNGGAAAMRCCPAKPRSAIAASGGPFSGGRLNPTSHAGCAGSTPRRHGTRRLASTEIPSITSVE